MNGLCADRRYDPEWWSTDADELDTCVAAGICSRCPMRAGCAAEAAAPGLWGCRWIPEPELPPLPPLPSHHKAPCRAERLAMAELALSVLDPADPAAIPARRSVLALI
jgi:hypothetical protein